MKLQLHLQIATSHSNNMPARKEFIQWIESALQMARAIAGHPEVIEVTIRLVDEQESAKLNEQYRHKSGPTNILSFPAENLLPDVSYYLGDLLICVPLVLKEAVEQGKASIAHWAHLTVHGVLHLLAYDHEQESEAMIMEALEIDILKQLGYENPYRELNIEP